MERISKIAGWVSIVCIVAMTALAIVLSVWVVRPSQCSPTADLNHDGVVNIYDLSIMAKEFGK